MRTGELQQEILEEKGIRKKTYTHQEVWKNVERILNDHYGTDYKLKL
ncbi:hypothetical protein FACS189474_4870 [Bacteroidia bacterium]|nr:hypothetical protein FACS189423_11230 [Bacteroidia bacterium]GHT88863.1 hypothetical protein FACS189474_4870 [Bacteroidia bacterium]